MANYGQMSMNNLGMNMNTIGMTINNNNNNTVQMNGINNIALPTRVNVLNNTIAVGNTATTAIRNVNGNYGMVNIANQNVANYQIRNGLNTRATTAVGGNRIVAANGLTYANANPAVLQQRVATQIPATANVQTNGLYNTYALNTNLINVTKKNSVDNVSPLSTATTNTAAINNVGQRLVQTYATTANLQTANLQTANLQTANLQAANLQTANLQTANLQAANLQAAQLQKPVQINAIQSQNIQLLNQNTVLTQPKAATTTLVQQPQTQQQKTTITTPVQSTSTINLQEKVKTMATTTSATMTKISTAATDSVGQTPVKTLKTENVTTPVATSNAASLTTTTLTPNSDGVNEASKLATSVNLKDSVKIEKIDANTTAVKPALATPSTTETEDVKKSLNINTATVTASSQPPRSGLVTPTTGGVTYSVANETAATTATTAAPKKTGSVVATPTSNTMTSPLTYNQGQNMYQKQFIATPTAVNFPQTAVAANNYQINKTFYPNGTNQASYLNQIAVKSINGSTAAVGVPPQQPGMTQKFYTIANGTYSNATNGTVQTGIKTLNPTTAPVSYTVGNNQKYVISNPMTNTTVLNNRVQGVGQYATVNNQITNVYQVSNNNAVKVNGYIPNNGQVVMNTLNNGQVSYVKVNPTVNGNVISNPSNIVNYNGTSATLVNNAAATATANPYLNKTTIPNANLMAGNVNGGFVKPLNQNPNQISPFLLTPPTTTTTSSRRRSDILRPPNPFILYRQEHHSKVLAEHEGISNTEISKIIGKMWKNESEEVKNKYKEKAQEMKRRHKLMYPDYRFAPRKQEEIRRRKKRKNITPPENEKKDDAKEEKKEDNNNKHEINETETVENAKKKIKTEESTVAAVSTSSSSSTSEVKKEIDLLEGFNPTKNIIDNDLTKIADDKNLLTAASSTTTLTNIPVTNNDASSNIITSNSLFSLDSTLDSSLTNINSFDIENFDIAEDNSFIDNYLSFNSNHTFQTTSDSMFNQLTDLLNTTTGKK